MTKHILQSREWGEFRAQTPNVKKVLRIGPFQIFIHRILHLPGFSNFPNSVAYLPRSVMPNPAQLEKIKIACRKENAIFLKIEPITIYNIQNTIYKVGRPILPQHTIYIDLTLSGGELLAGMHEKTRYNIKLAEKKGVVVKNEDGPEALENFIKLLEKTESRQGFYSHYPEYYRILWKTLHPAEMVYLLSAYLPAEVPLSGTEWGLPIASIMLLRYKDTLYYPYGGSDPQHRQFMAPHLLHWEAIKLGKKLGCKVYDMWGSYKNSPTESDLWWGIYRFKKGFGGKEIDFPPAIDIPLSPLYPLYSLFDSLRWKFLKLVR